MTADAAFSGTSSAPTTSKINSWGGGGNAAKLSSTLPVLNEENPQDEMDRNPNGQHNNNHAEFHNRRPQQQRQHRHYQRPTYNIFKKNKNNNNKVSPYREYRWGQLHDSEEGIDDDDDEQRALFLASGSGNGADSSAMYDTPPLEKRESGGGSSSTGNTNPNQAGRGSGGGHTSVSASATDTATDMATDTATDTATDGNNPDDRRQDGIDPSQPPSSALDKIWARAEHFFPTSALDNIANIVGDACSASPCHPRNLSKEFSSSIDAGGEADEPVLGITRLQPPQPASSMPAEERQQRQHEQGEQEEQPQPWESLDPEIVSRESRQQQQQPLGKGQLQQQSDQVISPFPHSPSRSQDRTLQQQQEEQQKHLREDVAGAARDGSKPASPVSPQHQTPTDDASSRDHCSVESAVDRRRQRHQARLQRHKRQQLRTAGGEPNDRMHEEIEVSQTNHVQVRLPPTNVASGNTSPSPKKKRHGSSSKKEIPVETLELKSDEAAELERSISELTMRSSYASTANGALSKIPDNRRMAYYAVGKHHRHSGKGGNRRCYFTGKLILGGAPFYAGTVHQGLRTLVVFCLPSAVGLPEKEALLKVSNATSGRMGSFSRTVASLSSTSRSPGMPPHPDGSNGKGLLGRVSKRFHNSRGVGAGGAGAASGGSVASTSASKSMSRLSSLDDLSLSIEGDLDVNWSLDRNFLLSVLPPSCPNLLQQIASTYPEQFETLPVQVRGSERWKLYVKFCFFSGLPIAEGELHYKVRDEIAERVYGEEIALSHDVMEASIGRSSAEILTLPNRTVLRYLRKHYVQQCGKLDEDVFQRASWERVAPEV